RLRMEEELHKRIVGQNDAIKAVSQAIRRTRAGLKDPKRPSGSFIFLGPSGVGKTETAKALAEFLFGDESSMIQLDMSEYMEKHTVHDELKRHFRPEFLNRIDDIIVFHQLSTEEIVEIVDLLIRRVQTQLDSQGLGFELTPEAKYLLATRGYDAQLGARPLRRA